jgi:hypothetical protein
MNITRLKFKPQLIFDKLSFTLPLSKLKRNQVLARLTNQGFCSKYAIENRKPRSKGNRYRNNYSFPIDDQNSMDVSVYPINTKHNFLRVEFNPDKLGRNGLIKARKLLVKLLGIDITQTIYFKAAITRIDLTVNLLGLQDEYIVFKTKTNVSAMKRSLEGTQIDSQIAGSSRSNVRVTFYNKNQEQQHKGKGVANPRGNYHRLEIRLRDLRFTMSQLDSSILQVFNSVSFYHADFLTDDWFSPDFLEHVQRKGLNSALYALGDSNERRCHLRHLSQYKQKLFSIDNLNFGKPHDLLSFLIQKGTRQKLLAQAL